MVITAQVDMNFIVVCERIMELQPGKEMNLMMKIWCQSLMLFWRSLSSLSSSSADVRSLVEPVARIEEIQRV